MKRILFALPMMALSTLVNAGVYECDMTKKSRYGWISEKIFIEFDEKARSAQDLRCLYICLLMTRNL